LNQTFGSFVRQKRMEQGLSLRGLAARLDLSPVYMSNIETGRKPVPARENLDKLTLELHLSKEEQELLLDLAARPETMRVSADLPEYIMERDIVRAALRTAKEVDATDEEWQEFIDRITKRTPSSRRDGP
jgi:transcriptional regulator with XRE-family HTH domain